MSKWNFISFTAVKKYIAKEQKMKSADSAINKIIKGVNGQIKKIIANAVKLSKEKRRKTILDQDVETALRKTIARTDLTWEELLQEILKQNPTELGKISEGIDIHLRKK